MRIAPGLAIAGVVALGLVSEAFGPGLADPRLWMPDLLVGWTLLITGVLAWWLRRAQPVATLLMATGIAWFAGFTPETLYWHRGPLVHLLLAFPGWRPRTTTATAAVGVGYLAAAVPAAWADTIVAVLLSMGLAGVAAFECVTAPPGARPTRRTALAASLLIAAAVMAASLLPVALGLAAVLPSLLAYQAAMAGVAVLLLVRLPHHSPVALTDTVVDLAGQPAGTLQRRLASALADPTVVLAYWSPTTRNFRTAAGDAVDTDVAGTDRRAVVVTREGRPFAVLEHDVQSLRDPRLIDAVARAVRLSDTNTALREQVAEVYAQVFESRRRLVLAADEERQRLDARLRAGPVRLLTGLGHTLEELDDGRDDALARAREHCQEGEADLLRLSNGLRPRDLDAGLLGAATAAAARLGMPVRVEAGPLPSTLPAETERTAYFVMAEALTNAAKHAGAHEVHLGLEWVPDRLRVSVHDDGVGGAHPASGSGLQGLADRVAAVGGALEVHSPDGAGTTVVATLPAPATR